jgi:N-acetylmuramoyl-L-alanine amidase
VVGEGRRARRHREVSGRRLRRSPATIVLLLACAAVVSCRRPADLEDLPPFDPGTEIVVCGERLDIGTPVVLWSDPIGFDAYRQRCRFNDQVLPAEPTSGPDGPSPLRYGSRSREIVTPRDLAEHVHLVVVHYDAVGSAQRCFRSLHDNRGLSAHFLLDLDGTLYQTLDLRERAFHAKDVNDVSIGIEIANIGAMSTPKLLEAWYGPDESGEIRNLFPAHARLGQQRRGDVIPRPARQEPIRGTIHRSKLVQYDFTDEQYDALSRLIAGLHRALPRVLLKVPRDRRGRVPTGVLEGGAALRFEGIVGHFHLDEQKLDPGPAFEWERLLAETKEALAEMREER